MKEQLGQEVFSILQRVSGDIDSCADFNRYPFQCDWTIALENALEPYHIPLIHTETLATLQLGVGVNDFSPRIPFGIRLLKMRRLRSASIV